MSKTLFANHVHLMPSWVMETGTIDTLLPLLDAIGAAGAVCFAPFSSQVAGRLRNANIWLSDTIKGRKGLVGYGTLDPDQAPEEQVKEIADLGFPGVKVHPSFQHFDMLGPWAMRAYEAIERHGLIADFHVGVHGHRLRECNPLDLDEISHRFPGLTMVFEHVGGWHFFHEVVAVIANNHWQKRTLFAGITGVLDYQANPAWFLGPQGLQECRWQLGDQSMIYGLDFPYNQLLRVQQDLEIIRNLGWPTKAVEALLGGNLRRLLRMA